MGDCTPTCDRGQTEVKRSRQNFGAGQAVKVGFGSSLETVKGSPGNQWVWLIVKGQRQIFDAVKGSSTKI